MSEQAGQQQQTVADALAQRVEARQGTGSGWAEALHELGAVDRAVYQAVARTPTPTVTRTPGPPRHGAARSNTRTA
jgi:hypothetical protein